MGFFLFCAILHKGDGVIISSGCSLIPGQLLPPYNYRYFILVPAKLSIIVDSNRFNTNEN